MGWPGDFGERAVFTPRVAGRPQPQHYSPMGQRYLSQAPPSSLGSPTHHPLIHVRPALALQTGLQALVDIVGRSLGWLQPLLHLGRTQVGGGGYGSWEVTAPSPLPLTTFLSPPPGGPCGPQLGGGMTQPRPPTGVAAQPSVDSLQGPALAPAAGPGMYLLEVLTQELGRLRLRGADGGGQRGDRGRASAELVQIGTPLHPPNNNRAPEPPGAFGPLPAGPALGGPPAFSSQSEHIPRG